MNDNRFTAPFLTLAEIQTRWPGGELKNDMIQGFSVEITGHFGGIVSPLFSLAEAQSFGCGYCSTANVGFIIRRMAELLDLFVDDTRDFARAIANCPIRLYSWGRAGDRYLEKLCVGHFMKDRFLHGAELMQTGLVLTEDCK